MKHKYVWLLALPYVVAYEKVPYMQGNDLKEIGHYRVGVIDCGLNKDQCDDLAAALNEAHERRTVKTPGGDAGNIYFKDSKKAGTISGVPVPCGVDSKSGVDDCLDNSSINSKKANWQPADFKKACEGPCSDDGME